MSHYVYGSGMLGCLYDNGPHFADTAEEAIEALLDTFGEDLTDEQQADMRRDLLDGYRYDLPEGCGADYCEVSLVEGERPSDDDC